MKNPLNETSVFIRQPKSIALALGISSGVVMGYVGSFYGLAGIFTMASIGLAIGAPIGYMSGLAHKEERNKKINSYDWGSTYISNDRAILCIEEAKLRQSQKKALRAAAITLIEHEKSDKFLVCADKKSHDRLLEILNEQRGKSVRYRPLSRKPSVQ